MKVKETPVTEVGVIIGRFQSPYLHEAHTDLIQSVVEKHPKTIIFLGLSPCKTTYNNPLDFEARKQMILEKFPNANVLYIKDEPSDSLWSKKLDGQINDLLGPNQKATLYGGRDSFIPHYTGKYPTVELEPKSFISASEIRKDVSNRVKASPDFRAGVIWATTNQFPSTYPTVDCAIVDKPNNRLLLARKSNETLYRFVGGFSDPEDESYEYTVKREVSEETGLDVSDLHYIGSKKIDDWRYRNEKNKIKTLFFVAQYIFGSPKASDDICEVKWFNINEIKESDVVDTHKPLLKMLMNFLQISGGPGVKE